MRIAVVGAGAMGCTFGGKLQCAGEDVILIDKDPRHVAAISGQGLRLRDPGSEAVIQIPATTRFEDVRSAGVALVMVDSNATCDVAPLIPALLAQDGFALTLQNGIGNVEALVESLGNDRVLAGCTYVSAALTGAGTAHNTNIGETHLGEADGTFSPRAEAAAELLRKAGFPCHAVPNVMGHVWSKFALNCALNPLSAITGLRTGEIARHPEMSGLLDAVIAEILAVVRAKGVELPDDDPARLIREHAWLRYNRPSMLQHVESGRPTEIGSLNEALVREADRLGVAVPANRTLAALVRGLDARNARSAAIDEAQLEAAARSGRPA